MVFSRAAHLKEKAGDTLHLLRRSKRKETGPKPGDEVILTSAAFLSLPTLRSIVVPKLLQEIVKHTYWLPHQESDEKIDNTLISVCSI